MLLKLRLLFLTPLSDLSMLLLLRLEQMSEDSRKVIATKEVSLTATE